MTFTRTKEMSTGDSKSKIAVGQQQQPQESTQGGFGGFGTNQPSQSGFGGFGTSQQVQSGFGSFGAGQSSQQSHDQVVGAEAFGKMATTINVLTKKVVAQGEQLAAQEKRLSELEAYVSQGGYGNGNGNDVSTEFKKFQGIFLGALGNLEKRLLQKQGQGNRRHQPFQDEDNSDEYQHDNVDRQIGYRGKHYDPNYRRPRGHEDRFQGQAPQQQYQPQPQYQQQGTK